METSRYGDNPAIAEISELIQQVQVLTYQAAYVRSRLGGIIPGLVEVAVDTSAE